VENEYSTTPVLVLDSEQPYPTTTDTSRNFEIPSKSGWEVMSRQVFLCDRAKLPIQE